MSQWIPTLYEDLLITVLRGTYWGFISSTLKVILPFKRLLYKRFLLYLLRLPLLLKRYFLQRHNHHLNSDSTSRFRLASSSASSTSRLAQSAPSISWQNRNLIFSTIIIEKFNSRPVAANTTNYYLNADSFEDFLKGIGECEDLEEARQIR